MKPIKSLFSWVEIPVTDMNRAKKFYEAILECKLQEMPLGDGLLMAFFPVEPDTVGGALCKQPQYYKPSENGVTVYLTADPDVESMLERVEKAGGKIIMPKKMISPESGHMALFIDCEGNRIAVYEKNK